MPSLRKLPLGTLFLLTGIFFFNFLSRIIWAPLLVTMEQDFQISHAQAGRLFLWISSGVCVALMGSGLISSRWTHRGAVLGCSAIMGLMLIAISMAPSLFILKFGLLGLGIGAGLYFPSGIAAIAGMAPPSRMGRAIAIHELAPNTAFVVAPLLVEGLSLIMDWRHIMAVLGGAALLMGALFARFGRTGYELGTAPKPSVLLELFRLPSYWIMAIMLGLAIGASIGVYTMVPLYLVVERGFDRSSANTVLALSRVAGIAMAFASGWLVDRLGVRRSIAIFVLGTGVFTAAIGKVPESWVIPVVFLQPLFAVAFFPAGFAAISRIVPQSQTNIAVGFTGPVAVLIGAGFMPSFLGWLAAQQMFSTGFEVLGLLTALGATLVVFVRFVDHQ